MLKIRIGAIFLTLITFFTCTFISAKTSYIQDNDGNDAWTSFLHDHSNSGYSSTVISQEPEFLDILNRNEGDTFYGAIIYDDILIASYSNNSDRISGIVAYDIEEREVVWETELSERFCFTTPAFNSGENTIFVATTDGYNIRGESSSTIMCIDVDDGTFEWESSVDGAIFQPLLYANNLIFYANYYCNGDDIGTQSEPGDIGCLDAEDGSKRWYKTMKYSFDDHSQLMAINGNQVLVPNTFLTHQEDNMYSAGDESIFYSFNQSTGSKNWEILKKNCNLPAISVDEDKLYLTYSAEDDDGFTQILEAYDFDRDLIWTYEINGSIGWCSTPIFNDEYIFLRSRNGKVYCVDKSTGKRIWNTASKFAFRSGDDSTYAVNDQYFIHALYDIDNESSYICMIDLEKRKSVPIWEETINDHIIQVLLYDHCIFLVGSEKIYIYWNKTPELHITPSSLTFSMDENATKTDYLKITNTGDGELKGTVSESESWMSVSPTSFEGDSTIQVTIDSNNLSEGSYSGEIEVKSNGGNQTIPVTVRVSEQDTSPPVLQITSPKDETETEEMQILVKGRVYDDESGIDTLTLNGEELYVDSKGYFEYYYDLSYGENTLELEAENKVGLITSKVLTVYRFDPDNTAPEITISYPQPNQNVYETPLIVKGSVTDEGSGVKSVMVNEKEVSFDEDGNFEATVSLELGKNTIQVEAVDYKGNKGSKTIYVQYLEKKPIVILLWIGNRIALVDSEPVTLDTPPLIYKGRTMVPVRFIAEAFGADVFYDAAEQEIDIAFGSVYISLWVNKTRARIEVTENGQRNNRIVILDAPPIIRNGRTLVPVRFIAEAFGATIDWDGKEEKITITLLAGSQGGNPPPPAGAEEVNQRGNSVGNIVNLGLVAQQGEWIY